LGRQLGAAQPTDSYHYAAENV